MKNEINEIDRKSASPYDDIVPYLSRPLSGLLVGYGCEPSKEVEMHGIKYRCCKLGAGGWGSVYLCERGNERMVVKMPFYAEAAFLGYERPTEYSRLIEQQHELEVLKSLDHPNILKLIEVRGPFLFYEYADQGSLAWQLANGYKPSVDDLLLLTLQISDALRYVHNRGILHGDIKPSNILLVEGVAKLADFSSAKLVAKDKSLSIPSTYGYRAPEQADKELRKKAKQLGIENRVDIYQLGSTLLHASVGEPLDGEDASEEEVTKRTEGLDERIVALLKEMLSIDPARRPSAEEVVKRAYALLKKKVLSEEGSQYRPYKPLRDREKEELRKKLEELKAELARKEFEIEHLRKERGRIPELEKEIQKLTNNISEIKEILKKGLRDPPIWALLEPGTYFNYDFKSIDPRDGHKDEGSINWKVLSKEHDRVRIQYTFNSTGDAIRAWNGTYVTPWLKKVETNLIDKNGYILEKDIRGSGSGFGNFSDRGIYGPSELKTYLWINPNEINIGDTIKNDNFGSLVVESTKIFGGRNCFYLKRQSENTTISVFYDKSTGLFIGYSTKSPIMKSKTQLTSTNARI